MLPRQRTAVLAACALILLALGLPWTTSSLIHSPGWLTPSYCVHLASGGVSCSPGFISPGFTLGSSARSGGETVARVFLVAALALVVLAWRSAQARWLVYAAGGLLLGILLAGLTMLGGQLAALAAAALLAYAGLTGRGWTARRTHSPPGRPAPSS